MIKGKSKQQSLWSKVRKNMTKEKVLSNEIGTALKVVSNYNDIFFKAPYLKTVNGLVVISITVELILDITVSSFR